MRVRSLRGHLTLGTTIVLAIVLAGAGIVVSRYVDRSERAALDDRLKRTAELSRETALAAVQRELPSGDRRLDNVLSATGTSLRLLLDGRELPAFGKPPPRGPAAAARRAAHVRGRRRALPLVRDPASTRSAGSRGWRSRRGWTRPSASCPSSTAGCWPSASAALLVAGLGVWFAADLLLRPLRRLRAATAGIAGTEDLDRRVPGDDGPAELRSLAASFNEMLARLGRSAADRERALAATRRFTADAGHELRTPLTSVQRDAVGAQPPSGDVRRASAPRWSATRWRRTAGSSTCSRACRRSRAATPRRSSTPTSSSPISSACR